MYWVCMHFTCMHFTSITHMYNFDILYILWFLITSLVWTKTHQHGLLPPQASSCRWPARPGQRRSWSCWISRLGDRPVGSQRTTGRGKKFWLFLWGKENMWGVSRSCMRRSWVSSEIPSSWKGITEYSSFVSRRARLRLFPGGVAMEWT